MTCNQLLNLNKKTKNKNLLKIGKMQKIANQPVKSQFDFDNDGFEYAPSEPSSAGKNDKNDQMQLSNSAKQIPKEQKLSVQPTPSNVQKSNTKTQQSLVYSTSSYDTHLQQSNPIQLNNQLKAQQIVANLDQESFRRQIQQQQTVINQEPQQSQRIIELEQKISQLEQQVIQEKLNSEQLRVYNHIIKHELERKLYNQGIFMVREKLCRSPSKKQGKEAPIDLYLEIQHNRMQMQAMQKEYKQKDYIITNLENQLKQVNDIKDLVKLRNDELTLQNEQLQKSVSQTMEMVNQANATISQLESEKDAMIQYIEELKQTQEHLAAELKYEEQQANDKTKKLNESQEQIKQLGEQTNKEQRSKQDLQQQVASVLKELQDCEEQKKQLSKLINEKHNELMQYQLQLSETNNKLMEYEQINRELSRQFNDSVQQLSVMKRQHDDQQSQINILTENLEQITNEYESNMTKTDRLERQAMDNEKLVQERDKQLGQSEEKLQKVIKKSKKLEDENQKLQILHKEFVHMKEELADVTQIKNKLELELEENRQLKTDELSSLYDQLTQLHKELRDSKEQIQQLQDERQQIIDELEQQSGDQKFNNEITHRLESELQEYKKIVAERDNSAAKLHSLQIKYQSDIEYYEKVINELQQKINENFGLNLTSSLDEKRTKELYQIVLKLEKLALDSVTDSLLSDKPIYQIDNLINQIRQLVNKMELSNQTKTTTNNYISIQDHSKQEDNLLKQQLTMKEREFDQYTRIIDSTSIQSVVQELNSIQQQLLQNEKSKNELQMMIQKEQFSFKDQISDELSLRNKSSSLLKISNLQQQMNDLSAKQNQLKLQQTELQKELENLHSRNQNLNTQTDRLPMKEPTVPYNQFIKSSAKKYQNQNTSELANVNVTTVKRKYFL